MTNFATRSTRSGLREWQQKLTQMEPKERLEVWRAAAGVDNRPSNAKRLGTALLEAEAKIALKDCIRNLTDAAVQSPKLAAPDLFVIAAIRDLTTDKKVKDEIAGVLIKFGGAAGRSRANSASLSPTPAEAQAALRLPKTAKEHYA